MELAGGVTLDGARMDGALMDGAASAELAALLDGIAGIAVDSTPKFTPAVRHALLGLIVGRAYAPPLLELCHLLWVAALAPRGRFERFFWGVGLARAGSYAGWVRTHLRPLGPSGPRVETEAGGVAVIYPDGRFAIAYGRMPLLAALMEFLVSALGYPDVLAHAERLLSAPARMAAAGEAANAMSRAVYAWLTPHLPTAHEKRRLDALVAWLTARHASDGRGFTTDDIDDAAILSFWLTCEHAEFRTYAAALRGFLLLAEAMEQAAAALAFARAAPLGTDMAAGEVEPAAGSPPDEAEPGPDPLASLAEPPADAVKLLNARERAELQTLLEAGPRGGRLALSLLRRAVFGAVQARISEALRRGGQPAAHGVLRALAEGIEAPAGAGPGSYEQWCVRADELAAHLERAMLASLHLLARAGRIEAVHLLVALGRDLDLSAWRDRALAADPQFLGQMLQDPVQAGPAVAALMLRARRAFQGLSRAGFEPDAAGRPGILAGHVAAAAQLTVLAARFGRMRESLSRRPIAEWRAQLAADRPVFIARFATIYAMTATETAP